MILPEPYGAPRSAPSFFPPILTRRVSRRPVPKSALVALPVGADRLTRQTVSRAARGPNNKADAMAPTPSSPDLDRVRLQRLRNVGFFSLCSWVGWGIYVLLRIVRETPPTPVGVTVLVQREKREISDVHFTSSVRRRRSANRLHG